MNKISPVTYVTAHLTIKSSGLANLSRRLQKTQTPRQVCHPLIRALDFNGKNVAEVQYNIDRNNIQNIENKGVCRAAVFLWLDDINWAVMKTLFCFDRKRRKRFYIWLLVFCGPLLVLSLPGESTPILILKAVAALPAMLLFNIPGHFLAAIFNEHYIVEEFGAVPTDLVGWVFIFIFWSLLAFFIAFLGRQNSK